LQPLFGFSNRIYKKQPLRLEAKGLFGKMKMFDRGLFLLQGL